MFGGNPQPSIKTFGGISVTRIRKSRQYGKYVCGGQAVPARYCRGWRPTIGTLGRAEVSSRILMSKYGLHTRMRQPARETLTNSLPVSTEMLVKNLGRRAAITKAEHIP